MMPGHWVVFEGKVYRLVRDISSAISGPRGMPVMAATYELYRPDVPVSYVTAAVESKYGITPVTHPGPVMIPECTECGARTGWECGTGCSVGTFDRLGSDG